MTTKIQELKTFKKSKPVEIDKDILDIKMWFGTWDDFKERIMELEDDEKEATYERLELDKLK